MMISSQRGILLLPVALMLAVIGTLAYTLTREGSMTVSAVQAEYDSETARYLAEAGVQLAKWQNEKFGCLLPVRFDTVDNLPPLPDLSKNRPSGKIVADAVSRPRKGVLQISLTAEAPSGTVRVLDNYQVTSYNRFRADELTVDDSGGTDTSLNKSNSSNLSNSSYLETTDGQSHAVLKFKLPGELDNASVLSAELRLTQYDTKSTQSPRSLAVHRVLLDWSSSATWATPWATPGGDYATTASATATIAGNGDYTWRIDALVEGWANGSIANQGLLLKPSGLLEARFYSFDASSKRPQIFVRYYPRC